MKTKFAWLLLIIVTVICSSHVYANKRYKHLLKPDASYEPPFEPVLLSASIKIDDDKDPPTEPRFLDVKYKKLTPYTSIEDRIKRLNFGISKTIPPEYDHYGHEIRRYMAEVGNLRVFEDEEFLKEQIKSVKKAKVVFDYWEQYLNKEIKEIDEYISTQPVTASGRTNLKQSKAQLKTFLIIMKSWLYANERYLTFIFENFEDIELEYPEILFLNQRPKIEMYNRFAFKQQKLKELKDFKPFEMMVY